MKKIINGKKYDTETATKIYGNSSGHSFSDFRFCSEALFLKKTGEYFLYGEGGPMSDYGENYGNGRGWGEKITPYSEEDARKWLEINADADTYEKCWGEIPE